MHQYKVTLILQEFWWQQIYITILILSQESSKSKTDILSSWIVPFLRLQNHLSGSRCVECKFKEEKIDTKKKKCIFHREMCKFIFKL